jgi:ubiquinone/menaquinone biosynthesis C-methylase UbiE
MSVAAYWNDAAAGWVRHADAQDAYGQPLGAAAFDRLAVRAGERVLDVGCGCGGTTAALARAAGPSGTVTGIDLSAEMIDAARVRFPEVTFVAGDIQTAGELPGAPFDAVYSRMVLMLLADPVAGLRSIRRAMRPGGRLAATVFGAGGDNPWLPMTVLGAAPFLGPMPPLPMGDEPGPFTWADPARAMSALTAAGFTAVTVEPVSVVVSAPFDAVEWLIEIGPAGGAYRRASSDDRSAARTGVARLLSRFSDAGSYRLPAGLHVITAVS